MSGTSGRFGATAFNPLLNPLPHRLLHPLLQPFLVPLLAPLPGPFDKHCHPGFLLSRQGCGILGLDFNQKIPVAGKVSMQFVGRRCQQVADIGGRGPAVLAVVDDDGQEEGILAAGAEVIAFEAFPDGGGVLHHPQRHEAVHGGLELEQDEDVDGWMGLIPGGGWRTPIARFGSQNCLCHSKGQVRPRMITEDTGMAARGRKVPEAQFRAMHQKLRQGLLTQREAAARLGLSERTFREYVSGMRSRGFQWWEPRPRPLPPSRRAPEEERQAVQRLYSEHYSGWNVRHFYEKYRVEHGGGRSYTWVKDLLQAAGLVERHARNGTRKRVAGMEQRRSTERSPREGMLLHQIASRREWTPGRTWDLMLTVDDATNRVYSGFFVEEREIWTAFRGIRETLERKGTFDCINARIALGEWLTANDSAFGGRTSDQLWRAISEVCPDPSREPHPWARQVRLIGTLRGRIPQELAARGIGEIGQANQFLTRFWPEFNESLGKPAESPSVFDGLSPQEAAGLTDRLCLKHDAQIVKGKRLSCNGREVELSRSGRQELSGSRVYRVHEYEDRSWKVFSRGTTGVDRLKWTELPTG